MMGAFSNMKTPFLKVFQSVEQSLSQSKVMMVMMIAIITIVNSTT